MLINQELLDRIGKEAKAIGFKRLRSWLYSSLVQDLAKICSDKDPRSPSITTVTQKLKDVPLRKQLEAKFVKRIVKWERQRFELLSTVDTRIT
jgi:hypothetical protein